jgi:hypothetical protein
MGHPRKYTTTAYIPRVLGVLAESQSPMTRKQIAAVIGTTPESIATAMLDLTRSGGIVKLPHTNAVAATYRLPIILPTKGEAEPPVRKRVWHTPRAFAYSETSPVSLPLEPWADHAPVEALEGGKDARKPKGVLA